MISTTELPLGVCRSATDRWFVTRVSDATGAVHELECAERRIIAWRRDRTSTDAPVLDLHIAARVVEPFTRVLPFLDAPRLHNALFVESRSGREQMFPLSVGARVPDPELCPRLAMLWILHDGPFGKFAWRNVFDGGRCLANDAAAPTDVEGTRWDIVIETDFVDCVAAFLGDLEVRDLITRGRVRGSIGAMSALSWYLEADEHIARTQRQRESAEMLCDWVSIARSDEVLDWASRLDIGR